MEKKKSPTTMKTLTLVCRTCCSVVTAGAVCPVCRVVEKTPCPVVNVTMQHQAAARNDPNDPKDRIALRYTPSGKWVVPGWYVYRFRDGKSLRTSDTPKEHLKLFYLDRGDLKGHARVEAARVEAAAWAAEKYGARDWVRNSVGDYVEREVNDAFPVTRR
jgi:hypothetical protein